MSAGESAQTDGGNNAESDKAIILLQCRIRGRMQKERVTEPAVLAQRVEAQLRSLGPGLRRLRQERGWNQEQLAQQAGIQQPQISAIELGVRLPSLRTLLRLYEALGTQHALAHKGKGG
jgi:DNA-binding XRE family transcriptional regulator